VLQDANRGASFQLADLWHRLYTGRWRLRDTFEAGGRYYAIVEDRLGDRRGLVRCVGLSIIEQILLGRSAKVVAIEREVTPSAVASSVKNGLRHIGSTGKLRAVHHIVVMAVRAARSPECKVLVGRLASLGGGTPQAYVVSVPRPRFELLNELSQGEREVMIALIEGASYAEIAQERRTSQRTIANQASVGFRKLRVSGRGEALACLMQRALDRGTGAPAQVAERESPTLSISGFTAPKGFSHSGLGRRPGVETAGVAEWAGAGLGAESTGAGVTALTGVANARRARRPLVAASAP
jgi:DNA-binding NarL/FixJ family response regulator